MRLSNKEMYNYRHIVCHECGLLIELTRLPEGNKAICPRCNYTLTSSHHDAQNRVIAFALSALLFLGLSFLFPFLTFSAQGQDRTVTLIESISVMVTENFISLAVLIFIVTVLIPGGYLIGVLYVYISFKCQQLLKGTRETLKLIGYLQHWNMAEIFLIGILVSFIKIASLAEISLGVSFIAYVLFILSMAAAVLHIDKQQAWQWLKQKECLPVSLATSGGEYHGCHQCTELAGLEQSHCHTCGSRLHPMGKHSIQNTWALIVTSILLYIPANFMPIMHTQFLGTETANTILGGVVVLWHHGSYPIAIIIFIASVLVPIGKIIALSWLCYSVQTASEKLYRHRIQLYRMVELVGRWSMVDVFVVAILVALIQMGKIMSIYPGWGAVAFAAMVILTMLAAMSFDSRLIWNPLNKESNND